MIFLYIVTFWITLTSYDSYACDQEDDWTTITEKDTYEMQQEQKKSFKWQFPVARAVRNSFQKQHKPMPTFQETSSNHVDPNQNTTSTLRDSMQHPTQSPQERSLQNIASSQDLGPRLSLSIEISDQTSPVPLQRLSPCAGDSNSSTSGSDTDRTCHRQHRMQNHIPIYTACTPAIQQASGSKNIGITELSSENILSIENPLYNTTYLNNLGATEYKSHEHNLPQAGSHNTNYNSCLEIDRESSISIDDSELKKNQASDLVSSNIFSIISLITSSCCTCFVTPDDHKKKIQN